MSPQLFALPLRAPARKIIQDRQREIEAFDRWLGKHR